MKKLRPPAPNYNNAFNNNSTTSSHLPPPKSNQYQSNNNINPNNNINNPFSSSRPGPQFSSPNTNSSSSNNLPKNQTSTPFQQNNNRNYRQFEENQNQSQTPKRDNDSFNSNRNNYNNNNYNSNNYTETEEKENEEINNIKKPKTSQKHKTPDSNYNINPSHIPRPNQNDEIYINNEKLPFFETAVGVPPPHSTSFYSVKETQNSSCRLIRSTLNSVPISQSLLNESNLLFGLCIQPFAEIPDYEEQIPKVNTGDSIFRCKQCNSYINNKYNISYSAQNKQVAICNLCQNENEFENSKPGVKSDYFNSDYSTCPELSKPTIDFIAPTNFKSSKLFVPHYLFMIDISENSYQLGLPSYVINSIQTNFDSFDNAQNSYIAFGLYDFKNIYFFYAEKEDIRLTIMGDLKDPFCPLSMKKFYLNIIEQREQIEKLIEKLNSFIEEKNANIPIVKGRRQISSLTGAAVKAGVDSLVENGGRLMVFTPNPCQHGFGACALRNTFDKEKEPQKANPFYPQNEEIFVKIGEKAVNNRIVVDLFIFMSQDFDLSTYSLVSNLSGGHVEYYNYSMDPITVKAMFEKLHYDLTRILTRPNYYDCKFMLRFSTGIDCVEILGPFNKKLGEAFQLGGCDPDYCYYYNMRLNETFKSGQKADIQLVILYDDNYSNRYLRTINFSLELTEEISKIFNNAEVDACAKAMIYKEISLMFRTDFKNVKRNLEDKIINSFKYYRVKEKSGTASNQLILPVSIRYLPLYIDSFLKTGILSMQNRPDMINQLIYIMNKLLREPIYSTMKFLYPKFYRIDNIESVQIVNNNIKIENIGLINDKYNIVQKPLLLRLSKDVIDFDCAYLIDNGCFIYLFIFNQIEGNFYSDLFGVSTFDEAKNLEDITLDEENQADLNQRLLNIISQLRKENSGHFQPVRIFFFGENGIINPILTDLLKEDRIEEYDNYPSYLCTIHKEIQTRIVA